MYTSDLVLYFKPTCPYCVKVLTWLSNHGIDLAKRDITADADAAETLVKVGGKRQVPCLFVDGSPMYESGDIITFLEGRL